MLRKLLLLGYVAGDPVTPEFVEFLSKVIHGRIHTYFNLQRRVEIVVAEKHLLESYSMAHQMGFLVYVFVWKEEEWAFDLMKDQNIRQRLCRTVVEEGNRRSVAHLYAGPCYEYFRSVPAREMYRSETYGSWDFGAGVVDFGAWAKNHEDKFGMVLIANGKVGSIVGKSTVRDVMTSICSNDSSIAVAVPKKDHADRLVAVYQETKTIRHNIKKITVSAEEDGKPDDQVDPTKDMLGTASVEELTAISSLACDQSSCTIRARVTMKSEVKRWSNWAGAGKWFECYLIDETGEIRATAFNDGVNMFYDLFKVGQVFLISGAKIKAATKQVNNVMKNAHELQLEISTIILPLEDSPSIPLRRKQNEDRPDARANLAHVHLRLERPPIPSDLPITATFNHLSPIVEQPATPSHQTPSVVGRVNPLLEEVHSAEEVVEVPLAQIRDKALLAQPEGKHCLVVGAISTDGEVMGLVVVLFTMDPAGQEHHLREAEFAMSQVRRFLSQEQLEHFLKLWEEKATFEKKRQAEEEEEEKSRKKVKEDVEVEEEEEEEEMDVPAPAFGEEGWLLSVFVRAARSLKMWFD
ncbi:Replication factor A protein 1 [Rhizophlyctis rosea]|uniref:Replication factor A protein 1 n=1 Tax=Rhizophlyctis rosea TaxID=64517 RepID=A0AAD5S9W8_9FUNG|nr:Replication factor A protein 1 [Rhizophlyctis rosea]